jgi:GalNAc-alpha-(1->4)-GalNAc-alpha-(1->3)-diNAcBac-PP-undecaprenol alpha-1,4-N-acetyl-D-galactosaminyltransferase
LATIGLGIPVIVSEQIDPRCHRLKLAWKLLRRLSYRWAARLVSCSAGVDSAFGWLPRTRRAVIFNPVCTAEVEKSADADAPGFAWSHTVVALGRLERQKGFDILIDAFARISGGFSDWGLAIFGEGSLRSALSSQIERLGLADRIALPGTTAAPMATFRRGDLFVLSSRYEGFGIALVEAMACGLPVVAADCPSGPSEIIDSGHDGLLVPPENAMALSEAMARLMSDAEERRRLGENARRAAQRFDLQAVVQSWEQTIDACL